MHPKLRALKDLGIALIEPPEGSASRSSLSLGPPDASVHAPLGRESFWRYCNPRVQYPFAQGKDVKPVFDFYDEHTGLAELLEKTRCFVLLGAGRSEQLTRLVEAGAVVIVLEPDPDRLVAALEGISLNRLRSEKVFYLSGDMDRLMPQLETVFTPELFSLGFPAFLAEDGPDHDQKQWITGLAEVLEYIEVLYYRHRIYPLTGHDLLRSRPVRDVRRGIYFDQQKHLYENLPRYVTCAGVDALANAFNGETAILVAAGPDLENRLDFLRRNQDKGLVICVNNALTVLLKQGIIPHLAIIIDSALIVEPSLLNLGRMDSTVLAAHTLSSTGEDTFSRVCFYGGCLPPMFPDTPFLAWHGSVITAAFSLARLAGCDRCVLVGAQLGSRDKKRLRHVAGTLPEAEKRAPSERLKDNYPVSTPSGQTLYTSPNFLDVALWFRMEIARAGLPVINTTRESLLFGPNIEHDSDPALSPKMDIRTKLDSLDLTREHQNMDQVERYMREHLGFWRQVARDAARALEGDPLAKGSLALFELYENNNVSYLVQRFQDFRNQRFHDLFFASNDPESKRRGLLYYFGYVRAMAEFFRDLLAKQMGVMQMGVMGFK